MGSPAVVEKAAENLGRLSSLHAEVDPTAAILSDLEVRPVLGTNVLGITFRGQNPDEATAIVSAIINAYRDYVRDLEHNSYMDTLQVLTDSERELRAELTSLEDEYQQRRTESDLMGQGRQASSIQATLLGQLGQSLQDTRNRRLELENQVEAVARHQRAAEAKKSLQASTLGTRQPFKNPGEDGELQLVSAAVGAPAPEFRDAGLWMTEAGLDVSDVQQELSRARVREKELSSRFGFRHPDVRAVKEQIATWEGLLQEQIDASPIVLQQELETVRLHEQRLVEHYEDELEKAKTMDAYLLKEQLTLDALDRTQAMYSSVRTQLNEWRLNSRSLAEGESGVTARVLEAPAPPLAPNWPSPLLLLGACGLFSLVGGLGTISLIERSTFMAATADASHRRREVQSSGQEPFVRS